MTKVLGSKLGALWTRINTILVPRQATVNSSGGYHTVTLQNCNTPTPDALVSFSIPASDESPTASTTTPSMDGTASVGTATTYARADHVHPTDTSRQATLVSGTNIKTVNGSSLLGSGNLTISTNSKTIWYGTCYTAEGTAAKVPQNISGFELVEGTVVSIYFSNSNTATTPTLNINSTGAKQIYEHNAAGSSTNLIKWPVKTTITFVYSGNHWVIVAKNKSDWYQVSVTTSYLPSGFNNRDVRVWANDEAKLLYVYVHYENTSGSNVSTGANAVFLTSTDSALYPAQSSTKAILDGFRYNSSTGALLDFPVILYQWNTTNKTWGIRGPAWSFDCSSLKFHGTIPYNALGITSR